MMAFASSTVYAVALLAEGVDRNFGLTLTALVFFVALLAEGVDRNNDSWHWVLQRLGRPPRGGRG